MEIISISKRIMVAINYNTLNKKTKLWVIVVMRKVGGAENTCFYRRLPANKYRGMRKFRMEKSLFCSYHYST